MTFVEDCIAFAGPVWQRYIHHPWIEALFAGTLSEAQFEYWLAQDLPYLGERVTAVAVGKAPYNHPWAKLEIEYLSRANATRVERRLIDKFGEFATTRWAARPRREAFINFFVRTAYEGTFGEICCAYYPCYAFPDTFGLRYQAEKPQGLPPMQVAWVEQWVEPFFIQLRDVTADAINECGPAALPRDQEKMKWIFLRAINHQIGTFDAAWNLSDPWPGEGEEAGVMAAPPVAEQQAA